MNNDKLEVPRELLERIAERGATSSFLSPHMVFELRALLDASESQYDGMASVQAWGVSDGIDELLFGKPAAQHQVEPVAWMKPDVLETLRKDECCYAFGEQSKNGNLIPLYRHPAEQPALVAWQKLAKDAAFFLSSALEANAQHMTPESLHAALEVCSKIRAEQPVPAVDLDLFWPAGSAEELAEFKEWLANKRLNTK